MVELQQGGNAPVTDVRVRVALSWPVVAGRTVDADASAFLLTAGGRVRSDADMVFYNQPSGADGAVRFQAPTAAGGTGQAGFDIDLGAMPVAIERVTLCVTIYEAQARGQTMALLAGAEISVGPAGGAPILRFRPDLGRAVEAAMTLGEFYRRQGGWKFRAVGQGFAGGLAPLARSFGIDVAEEPAAPPAPPPPPPKPPVRLSKVVLDKPRQTVSLDKRDAGGFGEIVVNLNWSRGRKGMFGSGTAIDLDLGCLLELEGGRVGVVLMENDRGALKATRIVEYFRDQQKLDEQFNWGLRWVAGRK